MSCYRVLHVMPGFGGGISSHIRNINLGINSEKVIIDVAGFTDYPDFFIKEISEKGGRLYQLNNVRLKNIKKCIDEYGNIIKDNKYDAVHLHLTDLQAVYFSTLSRIYGVHRVIVHAHIADQPNTKNVFVRLKYDVFKLLTRMSATQFASCSRIASEFRFGRKCVNDNKIMHIPNSIDINKYSFDYSQEEMKQLRDELNIPKDVIVIGNVGYFGYQKNHSFMLKLISELKRRSYNFVWIFVGTGHDFEKIKNEADKMGIINQCRFLGRRNDVNKLLQLMDVSVLPSHYEGLPTVAVESQAAGTPVVVSTEVTNEIDMGIGLVTRVELSAPLDSWVEAIDKARKQEIQNVADRISRIESLFFTAPAAAKLYTAFIAGKISNYNLGEKIDI